MARKDGKWGWLATNQIVKNCFSYLRSFTASKSTRTTIILGVDRTCHDLGSNRWHDHLSNIEFVGRWDMLTAWCAIIIRANSSGTLTNWCLMLTTWFSWAAVVVLGAMKCLLKVEPVSHVVKTSQHWVRSNQKGPALIPVGEPVFCVVISTLRQPVGTAGINSHKALSFSLSSQRSRRRTTSCSRGCWPSFLVEAQWQGVHLCQHQHGHGQSLSRTPGQPLVWGIVDGGRIFFAKLLPSRLNPWSSVALWSF